MDWPRLGAVLHMTGLWGRSYLGVERRAASRTWQKLCHREDTGLPWGKPYRGRIHIWDYPKGNQAIRTPSPVQGLTGDPGKLTPVLGLASDCSTQSDCRGCLEDSTRVHRPGNWTGEKKALVSPGEGEWRSKRDTGQFFPPIAYPTHGKKLAQRGDCRILRRCSVSPSPQLCRCLPKMRRAPTHGRRQHSWWSEPSPPGGTARLATGTPRQRPPLSSGPTSVWRQPSLSADKETKSCSELLTLRVRSTYMCNALTGHSNAKAGSASSEGSACRFTTWSWKGVVGTLGQAEHKALFAYRKRLEVPDPFDGSERGQERCLKRQELQLNWVQRLKGAPLKSSQDDREVPRGHKGRPGGIHPPGPLQEPHDEIMLSQGPAVHCIVVSHNSGYAHFQGGVWQPTLQPLLQERKHYSNRASLGVFSARRTPGREQTPFQCVGLPCWRSSSLNDGLYHRRW